MRIVEHAEPGGMVPYRSVPRADFRNFVGLNCPQIDAHDEPLGGASTFHLNNCRRCTDCSHRRTARTEPCLVNSSTRSFPFMFLLPGTQRRMTLNVPPRLFEVFLRCTACQKHVAVEYKSLIVTWLPVRMAMLCFELKSYPSHR